MKNLKLNIILLGLGLFLMVSCKDEEKTAEATPQPNEESTTTANEDVQVNPAHGLPGHRCDLPVGAPLNGTAANMSNSTNTTNTSTSTTVSPIRLDQSPTVNPPHGQPGHDCSIPVGQPLNN